MGSVRFLGPNGAGNNINPNDGRLLRPSSGCILRWPEVQEMRKGTIGICPQELVLWDYLGKESLMLMGDLYEVPREKLKKG